MAEKRLIIVVDSSAEMGPHWQTILSDYLQRIIRYFDGNASMSQGIYGTKSMFGLIVYGSQGTCNDSLVQPRGWTSDVDTFLQWLSGLSFTSAGGYDEAALAKGLSSALMMIEATRTGNEAQLFGKKHCILVTSSNSFPNLNPVPQQNNRVSGYGEISAAQIEGFLSDAATVAKSFIQSSVSLSVISPKQSSWLREIYNAGNLHKQTAESAVTDNKNLDYLILLSNNFIEAHAALNQQSSKGVPAAVGSQQTIDYGTYLVPPFQDNWSDEDMGMIQNIISEPLPASQCETRIGKILAAIELLMEEKCDDDDQIMLFQERVSELMDSQKEYLAENIPTTRAQQIPKNGRCKSVNDMMMIFQEALNQPVTNQQELLAESYSSTVSVQQKHERDKCKDDDDCIIIQEKLSNPSMSHQEIHAQDISTSTVEQHRRCDDETMIILEGILGESIMRRQQIPHDIATLLEKMEPEQASPWPTSWIEKGFGETKLTITPTGGVLSQNTSLGSLNQTKALKTTTITVGSPSESQILGSGYNSPHKNILPLSVKSEAVVPRTPRGAEYAKVDESTQNFCWSAPSTFKSESPGGAPRAALKNTTGFFGSGALKMNGNSKRPRIFTNFQGSSSANQLLPGRTGQAFPWAQMAKDGCRLKKKLTNAFGQSSITNGAGIAISLVENSEKRIKESIALTNTFDVKTPPHLQYASGELLERPPDGYVKAWEGDLTAREKGETVVVNRLVAYRKKTASEMLVANWPQTLHMEQLIAKPQEHNMRHGGEVEYLIFDAKNYQSKLDQLEEKRLRAYIRLPQQTLILSFSIEKSRFIGTLYNGDFAVLEHKIFNPLQQH
ncbi:mediator of RNA polymerase II transcription subunit 25-like isoform X2 [Actinidia eriantha]|uniref:mediator of RNA polymerase II transcription subunit 25-like isoform X2 n=1 Tax=Actinidia eriantha TaxID=165200 RepID=UPI00258F03D5|nr:mediator of RNA polymerase II transcription subunit 25-like isoform X2 [Actinidia eriantha]